VRNDDLHLYCIGIISNIEYKIHYTNVDAICRRGYRRANQEISNHIDLSRKKSIEKQKEEK